MKFKLLIAGLLLASALPGRSIAGGIDSTQWPFPDTIWIHCALSGKYTTEHSGHPPNGAFFDTTWTSVQSHSLPEYILFQPPFFTWHDVQSLDSNGWHLSKMESTNIRATLDILLDTVNHKCLSLRFHWTNEIWASPAEALDVHLKDLNYNRSRITITDDDLERHLNSASYELEMTDDLNHWLTTFCCVTGLEIFGHKLIPGFTPPTAIDFGLLGIGLSRDSMLELHNFSDTALTIRAYTLSSQDSGFSLPDTTLHSIAAQDSGTITIRFLPTKRQTYFDTIKIVTDQEVTNSYAISLTGSVQPLQSVAPELGLESLIQVSPNPATDRTTLRITAASNLEAVTLRIYDAAARLVVSKSFGHLSAGLNEIPIELPSTSGIYLARVTAGERAVGNLKIAVQ